MVSAELLGLIPGHFSPVNSATFLPDGRGFVTGAEEGFVRIYHFDASYFDASKLA
jgi:translation initiation factor 3 subunit I